MKHRLFAAAIILLSASLYSAEYYVSVTGSDGAPGTKRRPFRTINKAAFLLQPGDVCIIREGTYREQVRPARGGTSAEKRITYRAAKQERVTIKGSDQITSWVHDSGDTWLWKAADSAFKGHNPYRRVIEGEWLMSGKGTPLGDVFFNEIPFKWVDSLGEVLIRPYSWYVRHDVGLTTIYANFAGADPNTGMAEVVMRQACIRPDSVQINYIALQDLRIMHAAPGWSPPGALQEGMVDMHWSKGWLVERCEIGHAKTVGIMNCGRIKGQRKMEPGVMNTHLGHHEIRDNWIHDCGEAGIAGSSGWGASVIEGNLIEDICIKAEFGGYETAGIKIHAAVDVVIHGNIIRRVFTSHSSTFNEGIWLDFAGQGSRISGNLFYEIADHHVNLEMNHGPQLIDNNIFIGANAFHHTINNHSAQDVWVHNLMVSTTWNEVATDTRSSSYYEPHTMIGKGSETHRLWGDWISNNVFIEEGTESIPDIETFHVDHNVFYEGAVPGTNRYDSSSLTRRDLVSNFRYESTGRGARLAFNADSSPHAVSAPLITNALIGTNYLTGQGIEAHDGSKITVDQDIFGSMRNRTHPAAGPFESVQSGANSFVFEVSDRVPVSGRPTMLDARCSPGAVINNRDNPVTLTCRMLDSEKKIAKITGDVSRAGGPKSLTLRSSEPGIWTCTWTIPKDALPATGYAVIDAIDKKGTILGSWTARVRIIAPPQRKNHLLPGTIQAADYKNGGSGIGYWDTDRGNNGSKYRQDDVDIAECNLGGYCVGWTVTGEWLAYDIRCEKEFTGTLSLSLSSGSPGKKALHVELDGHDITGSIVFKDASGWEEWKEFKKENIRIPAGEHELKVVVDRGLFNVSHLEIK